MQPCATARRSETTATAVGSPPAPWPEKTTSPPKRPLTTTMFCVPCDHAMGEARGTSMGATRAWTICPSKLRAGDLADGAAELLGVGEVDGLDGGDGLRRDGVGIELGVHGDAREDAELGARVEAVDIGGGVGLGVAQLLRVGEHGGVARRRSPCG